MACIEIFLWSLRWWEKKIMKKTTPNSSLYKFTLGTQLRKHHRATKPQTAFNLFPVFSLLWLPLIFRRMKNEYIFTTKTTCEHSPFILQFSTQEKKKIKSCRGGSIARPIINQWLPSAIESFPFFNAYQHVLCCAVFQFGIQMRIRGRI